MGGHTATPVSKVYYSRAVRRRWCVYMSVGSYSQGHSENSSPLSGVCAHPTAPTATHTQGREEEEKWRGGEGGKEEEKKEKKEISAEEEKLF